MIQPSPLGTAGLQSLDEQRANSPAKARPRRACRQTKSTLLWLISAYCSALLLGAVTLASAESLPPHLAAPERVEAISAADFQQVLAHHRGKVLVVNLWATWCIPCVQELPDLNLLQKRYAERGLEVLAVSMDDPATLEDKVRPFFKERAPDLVSYLNSEADEYAFIDPIDPEWIGALPTTFFFDAAGELVEQHAGRLLYKDLERKVLELLPAK